MLIIIAGFPGVGKSTLAEKLKNEIDAVILDKDQLTKGITPRLHKILGLPVEDRESVLHKTVVRELTHEILYNSVIAVLKSDKNVIVDAPFEQYIQENDWYEGLCEKFGIKPFVIWVSVPKEQEYKQLLERNRDIDAWKLANFEKYYSQRAGMQIKVPDSDLYISDGNYEDIVKAIKEHYNL